MQTNYFILYGNCIPVKGIKRSVICDLQRDKIHFITNDLYEILNKEKDLPINDLLNKYGNENAETINEYFDYLLKNDLGFIGDEFDKNSIKRIKNKFDLPSKISNAIIDLNKESNYKIKKVISMLESLGCCFIQIRIFEEFELYEIEKILRLTEGTIIESIQLIICYHQTQIEDLKKIVLNHARISEVVVHTAPFNKTIIVENVKTSIEFTEQKVANETHCGFISPHYFVSNTKVFTESLKFNNCLNRKLSFDVSGNIKNCPAMNTIYGDVDNCEDIHSIIESKEFKNLWTINKDQIDVCNICEFRYVCTDCRAFLKKENILSKPLKCNYNPYTTLWEKS